jgi:ABC-type glycerol-3-phosphate transport system permease component
MNPYVILVFMLAIVGVIWYFFSSLKNKAKIIYTRPTGQEVEKMIGISERYFIFDKLRFDIQYEKHRLSWKSFLGIIGTWVVTYHLVWWNRYPEDPRDYKVRPADTPSVRHNLNQEEKFSAYQKAERDRYDVKKKGLGGIAQWIPWISLIVCVALVYLIFKQNSDMNVMKKVLQDILTKGG